MSVWVWLVLWVVLCAQIGMFRARRRSEGRPVGIVPGLISMLIFVAIFLHSRPREELTAWLIGGLAMALICGIAVGTLALIKLVLGRKEL